MLPLIRIAQRSIQRLSIRNKSEQLSLVITRVQYVFDVGFEFDGRLPGPFASKPGAFVIHNNQGIVPIKFKVTIIIFNL